MDISTRNFKHLRSKTHPDCLFQASTVYFGSSSIHAGGWHQHTGKITVEYHYLKAFADLDSAWSTASLVSSSEQENRAVRTNTLPNPCWSQRSQEMKCKKQSTPPHRICSPSPSHSTSFPIFSPFSPPSHLKNGVTFTTLMEKCCQRLSQSAKKFQKVSRSNPTLVNSKWYISGT